MAAPRRSPILWLAGPLLLAAITIVIMQWSRGANPLPMRDFVEYYSAGKAFLDHRNPYDPELLLAIQRQILNDTNIEQPVMMWNPPWALVLVAPLGLFPPQTGQLLWLALQFLMVLASIAMLLSVYEMPKQHWILGFLAGLVFCPFFLLIWYGQIGGFLLLGLAAYLFLDKINMPMTAGAFAALTSLKPHLFFAFGLMLLLDATVSSRTRRTILGGGIAILFAAAAVWLYNPMVYGYYFDSLGAPSSDKHMSVRDWYQPLVSYWFREAVAPGNFSVQFVPTLLASLALILLWLRSRQPLDWPRRLPGLIFISALCAAYGAWIFDLVVLLIPVIQAAALLNDSIAGKHSRSLAISIIYIIFNIACSVIRLS